MTATTRRVAAIMSAASLGVLLAVGAALLDRGGNGSDRVEGDSAIREVQATIRTDWLAPLSARRSLNQRNQALERWVADRGGFVRVLDTGSTLRTRDTDGTRLETPLVRLERTLIIRVPPQHAPSDLEQALAGLDVTMASIAWPAAAPGTRVEF